MYRFPSRKKGLKKGPDLFENIHEKGARSHLFYSLFIELSHSTSEDHRAKISIEQG